MIRLKKMLALAIAMIMVICAMNMGTFAATGTGQVSADPQIVVSGLTKGDVAHFYRVIEWENADADHTGGWVYTIPFSGMTKADGSDLTIAEITGNPAATPKVPMAITSEVAGIIARQAAAGDQPPTPVDVTAGEDGKAVLEIDGTNNKSGLYLVLITPFDANTVYNPVFVSSDYKPDSDQDLPSASWTIVTSAMTYSNNSAAKKSLLDVVKTAGTENDPAETAEIGKKIPFTVTTTIPGYGAVYTDPHFVIYDHLNNLKLDPDTEITVTVDTAGYTGTSDPYTVDTEEDGYTVTFAPEFLKTIAVPRAVKVEYTGIVTTEAVEGVNYEDNQVTIEYSHDPSHGDDYNVQKDTTQHYTFTIGAAIDTEENGIIKKSTSEIIKVGRDSGGKPITETKTYSQITSENSQQGPLEGAHFKLYTNPDCTKEYIPKDEDGNELSPLDIVSGPDGRMTITGLAAGSYWIKEVSAPEGYIKDTEAYEIKIEAELEEGEVTEYWDDDADAWFPENNAGGTRKPFTYKTELLKSYTITYDGKEVAHHEFSNPKTSIKVSWLEGESVEIPASFVNTQGVELPATGGIGTTIFYAIGTILVLGAGILLVTRRRMESK